MAVTGPSGPVDTAARTVAETAEPHRTWPLRWWYRLPTPSTSVIRGLGIASLVANIGLVVTGGAVRLTDSGLGCPTWPQCTAGSLVVHDAMGIHGFIEFGNRLLTFVLGAIAIVTWLAVMRYEPRRSSLRWLATWLLLFIPAQAVIGGITVLTDLNPWIVSFHLLSSLVIISIAVVFLRRIDEGDAPAVPTVNRPTVWVGYGTFAATWAVLYAGTIVTGSGPHAGDRSSPRTGLDPGQMAQLHADLVFLLVGLTVGALVALYAVHGPRRAIRAATWLLALEVAQGIVGFVQYFTGLPVPVVEIHLLGAALVIAAATWLLVGLRDRPTGRDTVSVN